MVYTAHFPRLHPSDFRVRSLDGVADDWSIDYDTLAPFFEENDRMMGVSGLAGDASRRFATGDSRGSTLSIYPLQIRLYVSERFVGNATAWDVNGQAVEIVARGKDTEVALALHVAQLPLSIKTIILLSGDADLVPLAQQAKQKGRKTLVVASRPAASVRFIRAAGQFIGLV